MKPRWMITVLLPLAPLRAAEPPKTTFIPLGESSYRFDWEGEEGRTYFAQYSTNLVDWFYFPEVDQGVVHDPLDMTPLDGGNLPLPKYFVRLKVREHPTLDPRNADFDNDGISNWDELTVYGTDPLKFSTAEDGNPDGYEDTDGDGISDQWERTLIGQSADPGSLTLEDIDPGDDFDGDGVSNLVEYQRGLNGWQKDTDGDGYGDRLSLDQKVWLKFDETSGTQAKDSSGENKNGTLAATAAWQTTGGIAGGAVQLHGGSDAVQLSASVLNGAGDLTVSLWFKTSAFPASQALLSAARTSQASELAVTLENGSTLRFYTGGGSSVNWPVGRSLANGLWHHVVLTRNVVTGKAALFLDGASFGSPQTVSLGTLSVESLVLGQRHQTVSSYVSAQAFTGSLDEVRVYSTVLPSSSLAELSGPGDLDRDGLPDNYELSLFGNLATLAGGGDDLDGDGTDNRHEFENGSDPNDWYNGQPPVITLASGGGQTIYKGERTRNPLVFLVTRSGTPLANAPVDLSHLELIGGIESPDGSVSATSLTLRTDALGKVSVYFKAD
ncbi:LamG domain-containing protein [Luteolibacter ambystomatis]|uniref:LamG domain-containing protein n=1 Tax=Luteolibacter ambystomatis TaxID=2824561 RepID=A0A975G9F8_9BACT|nr:LamG domain-containing protein [Luteolibacter ambystomatis]QUE51246.1 LamG domain-containing protein [Luteolibacter ambystomatis]